MHTNMQKFNDASETDPACLAKNSQKMETGRWILQNNIQKGAKNGNGEPKKKAKVAKSGRSAAPGFLTLLSPGTLFCWRT